MKKSRRNKINKTRRKQLNRKGPRKTSRRVRRLKGAGFVSDTASRAYYTTVGLPTLLKNRARYRKQEQIAADNAQIREQESMVKREQERQLEEEQRGQPLDIDTVGYMLETNPAMASRITDDYYTRRGRSSPQEDVPVGGRKRKYRRAMFTDTPKRRF
jgi:hypothetical protein